VKRPDVLRASKEQWLGKAIRWWEFICAGCGESGLWPGTLAQATRQAREQGWRRQTSPAGRLWSCGGCMAEQNRRQA